MLEDTWKPKEHDLQVASVKTVPGHWFFGLGFTECVIVGEGMENERKKVGDGVFCLFEDRTPRPNI